MRGRRIVVFIVGGMTRSEVRVAHKLTAALQQEVILGSTSIDSPHTFLQVSARQHAVIDEPGCSRGP